MHLTVQLLEDLLDRMIRGRKGTKKAARRQLLFNSFDLKDERITRASFLYCSCRALRNQVGSFDLKFASKPTVGNRRSLAF